MELKKFPEKSKNEWAEAQQKRWEIMENVQLERVLQRKDIAKRLIKILKVTAYGLNPVPGFGNIKMGVETILGRDLAGAKLNGRERSMYALIVTCSALYHYLGIHGATNGNVGEAMAAIPVWAVTLGLMTKQTRSQVKGVFIEGREYAKEIKDIADKGNKVIEDYGIENAKELVVRAQSERSNDDK